MTNKIIIFFTIYFLNGCVTPVKNINPSSIPAVYLEYFKKCSPAEGSLRFNYSKQNQRLSFKSDWLAKNDKNWEVHFLDDIGRLQLGIKNVNLSLQVSGRAAQMVPQMQIDSKGRLLIQGYFSGLLAKELPCVLAGSLPSEWLYSLVSIEDNKDFTANFSSADRVIQTRFKDSNGTSGSEVCTQIKWDVMGFLSQNSYWCFERSKGPKSRILFKDHTLVWKSIRGN